MKDKKTLYLLLILLIIAGGSYMLRNSIQNLVLYGFNHWPSHGSNLGCKWEKTVFEKAGLTTFVQNCPTSDSEMTFFDGDKKIVGKWPTNSSYEFTIQVLSKSSNKLATDIVNEWYDKLTTAQKKVCSIQNADTPLEYFPSGELMSSEGPHPTNHKNRYKIDVKPEVLQQIWEENGGDPGSGQGRDFMCGRQVGSVWGTHAPYFEFDDRNTGEYIQVGSYGQDGPTIDLNSIRF